MLYVRLPPVARQLFPDGTLAISGPFAEFCVQYIYIVYCCNYRCVMPIVIFDDEAKIIFLSLGLCYSSHFENLVGASANYESYFKFLKINWCLSEHEC